MSKYGMTQGGLHRDGQHVDCPLSVDHNQCGLWCAQFEVAMWEDSDPPIYCARLHCCHVDYPLSDYPQNAYQGGEGE